MSGLRRRSATLLAAGLTGVLALSGCSVYDAPLPGGPDTGDDPMRVTVMFRDVLDLVPQSTVKVNDVTVGKVSEIKLKGYVAEVTVELPKDTKLPDNAVAQIRQTSLLGEKFVDLDQPQEPSSDLLSDKDVIGLERTGRNPEVEEVFGALSLLLNGGGVGQLKTIAAELNLAFDGREPELRSALTQIRTFMGQLDRNKESIVAALENTNRLAEQIRKQDKTIKSALDNIPATLRSVNRQRDDLVKLLEALERLSGVGVRVIKASKESTINSLRDLAPVLDGFAKAGDAFPESFQVFLTYPFVDAAIGRDPQVARNLHMGDFTNLSVNLDLDVTDFTVPGLPPPPAAACEALAQVLRQARQNVNKAARQVVGGVPDNPLITNDERDELRKAIVDDLIGGALEQAEEQCKAPGVAGLREAGSALVEGLLGDLEILTAAQIRQLLNGELGELGGALDGITGGNGGANLPGNLGLPRAQLGEDFQEPEQLDPFNLAAFGLDPGIGTILFQGVAEVR